MKYNHQITNKVGKQLTTWQKYIYDNIDNFINELEKHFDIYDKLEFSPYSDSIYLGISIKNKNTYYNIRISDHDIIDYGNNITSIYFIYVNSILIYKINKYLLKYN